MLQSYEEFGKFYITDGTITFETPFYISPDECQWNEDIGYTYQRKQLWEYGWELMKKRLGI